MAARGYGDSTAEGINAVGAGQIGMQTYMIGARLRIEMGWIIARYGSAIPEVPDRQLRVHMCERVWIACVHEHSGAGAAGRWIRDVYLRRLQRSVCQRSGKPLG